jgi:NADPH-dependent 2,4-dienoyl-CoA reductase/sulfur reductase-like enzyme
MNTGHDHDSHLSLDELREKYRLEREKRLRPEGIHQYRELSAVDEEFDRDPFADPAVTRDPVVDDVDVLIVGAGFGGMLTAIDLTRAGIRSFRIVDKAATSAARGTGTATRVPPATWSRTCTSRCSRTPGTCPPRST